MWGHRGGSPREIPLRDPPRVSTHLAWTPWGIPGGCTGGIRGDAPPVDHPFPHGPPGGPPGISTGGKSWGGELWHTLGIPARIPCGLSGAIQRVGWPSWCDPIGPPPRGVPSRDPPRGSLESPREFPQGTPCGPPTKEPLEIGSNFSAVIPRLFFSGDGR